MTNQHPVAPGWYRAADGSTQWWNGQAWSAPPPGAAGLRTDAAPTDQQPRQAQAHLEQPVRAQAMQPHPSAPAQPQQTVVHHVLHTPKSVGVAYAFALLLGEFGAHRFYLGKPVSAIVVMLLWLTGIATAWIVIGFFLLAPAFIWWVIDLCILPGMVRAENARRLGR